MSDPSEVITTRGSAQSVKSEIAKNVIGAFIQDNPRPILVVLPSKDEVYKYEATKLDPMFRACDGLARRVYGVTRRPNEKKKMTATLKDFQGDGFLQLTWAGSSKGLQMISVGLIVCEEITEYPDETGGRGFAVDQAKARGTSYSDRGELKLLIVSTPGLKGKCKTTQYFEAGDQRWNFWKCIHCGDYFRLRFSHLAEYERRCVAFAPCCGGMIENRHKREMDAYDQDIPCFVSENPDNQVPWARDADGKVIEDVIPAADFEAARNRDTEGRDKSFHIFRGWVPHQPWANIWKLWLEAKDDPLKLKTFYQQVLGEPYEAAIDVPPADALFEMRGGAPASASSPVRRGLIPPWAGFVIQSADLQVDRIEAATYAFGPRMMACIDTVVIPVSPMLDESWTRLRSYFSTLWESSHMRPQRAERCLIDTGGQDTQMAYRFIMANPHIIGIKGMPGKDTRFNPMIQQSRKGGRLKSSEGKTLHRVPLWLVNTHNFKKVIFFALSQALAAKESGEVKAGLHLFTHDETSKDFFEQITNEHLIVDPLKDSEKWDKRGPNEQLDLAVYAKAGADMFGYEAMTPDDWQRRFMEMAIDAATVDMGPLEKLMHEPAPVDVPINDIPKPDTPDFLKRLSNLNKRQT